MLILVLGATGYIGQAFTRELRRRGAPFIPLTRTAVDYTCFEELFSYVRRMKPEFIVNAAGYVGKPDIESCEDAREETLWGNTLLPQTVGRVCLMTNTPWAHISCGSVYCGGKVVYGGQPRVVRNLNTPQMRCLFELNPQLFRGFSEEDQSNCSFRDSTRNFYSGTKALAEEIVARLGQNYIWRFQAPFDEVDKLPNLLSRLQHCSKVYDYLASFSQLEESVRACLDLWEQHAPYGVYNIANPGAISTRQIATMIQYVLKTDRVFEFWAEDDELYHDAATTPLANSILDVSKLLKTGVRMRPVAEALQACLEDWQPSELSRRRRKYIEFQSMAG